MDQDALLRLIGDIYDAACDIDRWPQALRDIADAFGAQEASLSTVGANSVPWLVAPRSDPSFLASYATYYHQRNLFWQNMSRLPAATVVTDRMVMSKGDLHRSEFFNDWSKPQGYLSVLGATLLVEDGLRTEFVVPGRHDFDTHHLKLYDALAPHLVRAVQINQRLARAAVDRASTAAALDRLEQGVLLVGADARVMFSNKAAEAALLRGGLQLRKGILCAGRSADTAVLQAMIAQCGERGAYDPGGYVAISRNDDLPALSLLIAPMSAEVAWLARQPAAIVFVSDPLVVQQPDAAQLRLQFGLTRAEARFALEAIKGDGMAATAERLGILPGTARAHLHRVLAKTGTRRQAELVRLLLHTRHAVRLD